MVAQWMDTACCKQLLQAGACTRTDSTTHISLLDPRCLNSSNSHLKLHLPQESTSNLQESCFTTGSNQNHSTDHDQNVQQQPDGRPSVQWTLVVCCSHVLVCARRRLDCASFNAPTASHTRTHRTTGQRSAAVFCLKLEAQST